MTKSLEDTLVSHIIPPLVSEKNNVTPLPESEKKLNPQESGTTTQTSSFAAYSGPIPPPPFLVEYEKICPGIAKRLLEAPLDEALHRRSLDKTTVDGQLKLSKRGQTMAFCLTILCLLLALAMVVLGHSLEGLGVFLGAIATIASVFCYIKKRQ